jgi:Na+-driven multidrug efflux pump
MDKIKYMFWNQKNQQDFTEKYLESTKKNALRYWVLVYILLILIYTLTLSFVSGYLAGNKYTNFDAVVNLLISGLLSLITGIISYFFGIEIGKKAESKDGKTNPTEEIK